MLAADFGADDLIVEEFRRADYRKILLLGASDTGKTSFIEAICPALGASALAVVDLDAGQSRLGPPTTIAWGFVPAGGFSWDSPAVEDIYFTGATSPVGNLLPTLTGAGVIVEAAARQAGKVLIDTSGLIGGPGRALKLSKIDLLKPDVIVALQRESEIEPILTGLRFQECPHIIRLTVPPAIADKTPAQRTAYRAGQFKRYFATGKLHRCPWSRFGLVDRGGRKPAAGAELAAGARKDSRDWRFKLVGLRDARGKDRALGVIVRTDLKNKEWTVLAPLSDLREIRTIVFGKLRVAPRTGEQLAYFR